MPSPEKNNCSSFAGLLGTFFNKTYLLNRKFAVFCQNLKNVIFSRNSEKNRIKRSKDMLGMIFLRFNVSCFDNIILSGQFQCQHNFFHISLRNVFEFRILLLQKMGVFSPYFKILRHPLFLNRFETMISRFYIQFAFQRYIILPSISQIKVVRFFLQKSQW